MSNSFQIGKRALTVAVAAATILWSVGFSAFVIPMTASATSAGDVVRSTSLSTLYYYASNGKRYAFPNEKTYLTWYSSFSGVVTLSDSEMAAIPLAGNVVYRPGSRWVKIQSDPKTYAVTPSGAIRWIETEAVAVGLAGSSWNTFIDDVADVFFADYTVGASLTSAANGYNGMLVSSGGSTYLLWGGQKRLVSGDGLSLNRYQTRFVLSGTGVSVSGLTSGADLSSADSELTNTAQTGAVVTTTGGLTVSLASDSPASMTLPSQASGVTVMKFNLTASSGAVTISQIDLRMSGLGATTNITSTYLYEGNSRLTNAKTFNSTTRVAYFGSLALSLTAGQTRTLSVVVDMADVTSSGNTFDVDITAASSITSTATVSGSFPVTSAVMNTSSTDVGSVTIAKNGTITNPIVGGEKHKVAEFKLTAGSSEDVKLYRVKLDVRSAADHSNFTLWQGSTKLADGTKGADTVTFVLPNPYTISQGNNRIFQVQADVGGENGDFIKVALEETSDIYAVGAKYGFGVVVTKTDYDETGGNCAATTDDCSYSVVQGGKLTFAFNGPVATKIGRDSTGVKLFRFTLTSQNATEIRDIDFSFAGSDFEGTASTDFNYQNFRLVNAATGNTVMGPMEFADSTTTATVATLDFTDDFSMTAGQSIDVELLADVKSGTAPYDVADADTITATLDVSGISARDSNNDDLTLGTDIVPSADIAGNAMTVDISALTIAEATPPANKTVVKGAQNVDFLGLSFQAGASSDITVSAITFAGYGDDDATFAADAKDVDPSSYILSCSLYDGTSGALIDGPESFTGTFAAGSGLDVAFSGFSWIIPAGETYKMIARCNLPNITPQNVGGAGANDIFALELNAAADVTSVNDDGDAVDETLTSGNTTQTVGITVTAAGSLAVVLAGDNPNSTIVLSNSTGVLVSKFKVTATNESFKITKLTMENDDLGALNGVTSLMLEYLNQAGATKTATGYLVGGIATFDGLELYAPQDNPVYLSVKANSGDFTVSSDNAVSASGDVMDIEWSSDEDNDDEFEATGLSSGTKLDDDDLASSFAGANTDAFLAANAHTMYKTKPTLSLASGSPSGAGVPGLSEVFRFNLAADSRGDVTVDELVFKVTISENGATAWNLCDLDDGATGLDNDDFTLYNTADLATAIEGGDSDWVLYDSDNTTCADDGAETIDYLGLTLTTSQVISAGTTKTYALYMDTTGANSANDDSIRVDIPLEAEAPTGGTDPDGVILWDDSNMTNAAGLNVDGTLVKNLPVTGGTIVY